MSKRIVARVWSWSLLDQGLVSGANFVCGVLLARALGLEAFGAYVIAQTYLLYANTFQSALVVSPMMTAVPAETSTNQRRLLLRGFFGFMLLVMVLTSGGVQLIALVLGQWSSTLALGELAIPLGAAICAFQLQDWLRRAEYVADAHRAVFFNDFVAYGGQLIALGVLASDSRLTPALALWVLTGSFSLAGLVTLTRLKLIPSVAGIRIVGVKHWRASLDFLATWQLQWLGSSGVILMGSGVIGAQAAGAIRAVANLLGPVNVAFQWMDNVVPVRSARRFRDGGRAALSAYLGKANRVGMATLGVMTLLLLLTDEWLMTSLYGEEFKPYASLVVLQAIYYLFGNAYRTQSYYNRTINQTALLARASIFWAVAAMICAALLIGPLGERGIMYALILGEISGLAYLLWNRSIRPSPEDAAQSGHIELKMPRGARLILPVANPQVLRGVLSMYFPSRWTGRVYRSLLTVTLPAWHAMGFARPADLRSICVHLPLLVGLGTGTKQAWAGALLAAGGERSKFTIRLMRESGAATLYARVAHEPAAMKVIEHEARVLAALARTPAALSAPALVGHGALDAPAAYFLAETAGPESVAGNELSHRHYEFLTHLLQPGSSLAIRQACTATEADWKRLVEEGSDPADLDRVRALLDRHGSVTLPACIAHGDFAPWNIRRQDDGSLFVIDWEHASLLALPWMDALHFQFQLDATVRRLPGRRVAASLLGVFLSPQAEGYRAATGFTADMARPLAALYLLSSLHAGCVAGRDRHSAGQAIRLRCLGHIVEADDRAC